MRIARFFAAAALGSLVSGTAVESQPVAAPRAATDALTYADLADLALPAPIAAEATLRRATRLDPKRAPGLAPGRSRFYIEAEVNGVIRGRQGLPTRITYLADIADLPTGKPARPRRGDRVILFARPVAGRPGEVQLAAPDAQIAWSPDRAARVRALLTEALSGDAPPAIVGIGRAFHVAGTLPGESETQLFLQAQGDRPVSLSVLRRPGETPRWAVSLAEIVDETAAPPARDTLLWYRLACTLPARLPQHSFSEADPANHAAIAADYQLVKDRLGACTRSRS